MKSKNISINQQNLNLPSSPLSRMIIFIFLVIFCNAEGVSASQHIRYSVKSLDLTKAPSNKEIMAAGQLGGALYPTFEDDNKKKEKEANLSFGKAIQSWNKHEYQKAVELFKKYLEEYPESPWVSEAVLHIGCDARYNGRYREAEKRFKWIIEKNKGSNYSGAKKLVDKARLRLANIKGFQNNFEESEKHFAILKKEGQDWRPRTYASHWVQRLSKYKKKRLSMLNCGVLALGEILKKHGKKAAAAEVMKILPASLKGQTIKDLQIISEKYGYTLTGLRLSAKDLTKIPLPAVVQVSAKNKGDSGHYWVLEKISENNIFLFDPQAKRRFRQNFAEFNKEWGGVVLVFGKQKNLPGVVLAQNEIQELSGGCCGVEREPSDLGNSGGNQDSGDPEDGCGAPKWSVNVINMNFFVTDTPLWYRSPIGPSVEITLNYNSQASTAQYEPFGNKWQFNYGSYLVVDPGGNVSVYMPDGRIDAFNPDGGGGYTPPIEVYNELTKIAENHFELRLPNDTVYVYNIPPGTGSLQPFLLEIKDAHGKSLTFSYNVNVELASITDAMGRVTNLTYNLDGLVTQVDDPFGRSAYFEYDADKNLTKITDMGGYWSELNYDANVFMTSIQNDKGTWTFYTEPADGVDNFDDIYPAPGDTMWENYRITITDPLGQKSEYYYDGYHGYSWYVSPRDYIPYTDSSNNNYASDVPKTYYYFTTISGGKGKIDSIKTPSEEEIRDNTYDWSTGELTSVSDDSGHSTSYTYNDMGRVTSTTDAKGNTTTLVYDTNKVDLLQIQNGLGTITNTYNSTHNLTSSTDRLGNTTTFTYNSNGQKTSETDPLGIVTNYSYNSNNLLQYVIRAGNTLLNFTYDAIGRVATKTDATGQTLTYGYNDLNNLTSVTYPDSKSTTYTYSGCCPHIVDTITNRSGQTTSYSYDALNRLVEETNPGGGLTTYGYDANGNLTTLLDPKANTTTFEYDVDDRLVKKSYADGKYETRSYVEAGLVSTIINARETTITNTYDANHNLLTVGYSDSTPGVTYQYDNYNRMTQRIDGIGTYQFSYDAGSRLTGVDGPWDNDAITYQYDALERRTSLQVQGGTAVTESYDNLDRLTTVQVGTDGYTYGYSGANPIIQSLSRPNGSFTTYQYDSLNRLTEISNKDSSSAIIEQHNYTYNQQDLRSGESITNGNPLPDIPIKQVSYSCNNVNQLLSATNPDQAFTYDDDGNLTQGYTPDGYQFAAAYDGENRLTSLEYTDSAGTVYRTEYSYSGNNFIARLKEYENGALVQETRFIRDGLLVLQERDGSNNLTREYAWGQNMGGGIGGLLNLKQAGQDYSYLYDGKGNVSIILDASEAEVASYRYYPFGNLMTKTGSLDQPFQFSTKRYDENTGLTYYGYRFYLPAFKRWTNRDPIGEIGGINLYGFVEGNPPNWIDPYGLESSKNNSQKNCFPFIGASVRTSSTPISEPEPIPPLMATSFYTSSIPLEDIELKLPEFDKSPDETPTKIPNFNLPIYMLDQIRMIPLNK